MSTNSRLNVADINSGYINSVTKLRFRTTMVNRKLAFSERTVVAWQNMSWELWFKLKLGEYFSCCRGTTYQNFSDRYNEHLLEFFKAEFQVNDATKAFDDMLRNVSQTSLSDRSIRIAEGFWDYFNNKPERSNSQQCYLAAMELAKSYHEGRGVRRNLEQAKRYAQVALGFLVKSGVKPHDAFADRLFFGAVRKDSIRVTNEYWANYQLGALVCAIKCVQQTPQRYDEVRIDFRNIIEDLRSQRQECAIKQKLLDLPASVLFKIAEDCQIDRDWVLFLFIERCEAHPEEVVDGVLSHLVDAYRARNDFGKALLLYCEKVKAPKHGTINGLIGDIGGADKLTNEHLNALAKYGGKFNSDAKLRVAHFLLKRNQEGDVQKAVVFYYYLLDIYHDSEADLNRLLPRILKCLQKYKAILQHCNSADLLQLANKFRELAENLEDDLSCLDTSKARQFREVSLLLSEAALNETFTFDSEDLVAKVFIAVGDRPKKLDQVPEEPLNEEEEDAENLIVEESALIEEPDENGYGTEDMLKLIRDMQEILCKRPC